MKTTQCAILACVTASLLWASPLRAQEPVDFGRDLLPILEDTCEGGFCHIGGVASGVELTSWELTIASVGDFYGQLIVVPFDPDGSPLVDKLENDFPRFGQRMPIGREPWSPEELSLLRRWVLEGARRSAVEAPQRGDASGDGKIDLDDAFVVLGFLFEGTRTPICLPAADADGDEWLGISDAIYILRFLFLGGPAPPPLSTEEARLCSGVDGD